MPGAMREPTKSRDRMMEVAKIEPKVYSSSLEFDWREQQIILCATEAFLSKGYAAANVEDIANKANVGKPTIYRIFDDKYGLATAVLQYLANDLEKACRSAIDMDADPEECLVKLGITYIRWMKKSIGKTHNYAILRLLTEMSGPFPEFTQIWREAGSRATAIPLSEYISARMESGELVGDDPFFIASQFMGSVYHTAQSVLSENDFNSDIDLTRKKVQLFLGGCTRRGS